MDKFIAKLFKDFEDGKMSGRQLIQTIKVAAITFAAGETAANAAPSSTGFKTIAVNHISYSCPDYSIARDFYQHLMGMSVVQDSGRQCMMPFGAAGTHLLPRGYRASPDGYTTSGAITAPPAQRGNRGGGGGAAAAGGRGGAGATAALTRLRRAAGPGSGYRSYRSHCFHGEELGQSTRQSDPRSLGSVSHGRQRQLPCEGSIWIRLANQRTGNDRLPGNNEKRCR